MQRCLFIVYLLFHILTGHTQQNQTGFISAAEMLNAFCEKYQVENTAEEYITFEKRRGGWYVVSNKFENSKGLKPYRSQLFRAVSDTGFRQLSFPKSSETNPQKPESLMDEASRVNFDIQPSYGYNSWFKDVIADLGSKKNLSDNELYALGRAYSSQAMGYVSNYSGFVDESDTWVLPFAINALSNEQIEIFRKEEEKALKCFKSLFDRNPGYETYVGKIGVKYANEIMFQYQVFLCYAASYAEQIELPVDLYQDSDLEESLSLLNACPPDAILLSFGDNDFYPVHYLQKARGIRNDVYVINYNLLGVDRYINRFRYAQYNARPVTISVDTAYYMGAVNDVIYVENGDLKFPVQQFKQFFDNTPLNELERQTLKAGSILLDPGGSKGQVEVNLQQADYLLKNQWILLDILNNLNGRKVCMNSKFYDELTDLNNYLDNREAVWEF